MWNQPTFDFGLGKSGADWLIINDGVMGGLSQGRVSLTDSSLLYSGRISLKNNGGFSSLRSRFSPMDLSTFETVTIRFRSQGQPFAFVLETSRVWYEPSYRYQFAAADDDWKTVTMNLSEFKETRIGRETGQRISKNQLGDVIRLGFINAGKYESEFVLEIDYITFE
ncbi:MAG: CIA30 family protein [Bacteroidia bacterium]|nr:CIA30 family protein [Bacteroidia bacterium]